MLSTEPKLQSETLIVTLGNLAVPGFFFQLGKLTGSKLRRANWYWRALTGTESEAIEAERRIGKELSDAIARESALDDPRSREFLDELGGRLAGSVKDRRRSFVFQILNAPEPNAFALPGGFIWVTGSLLELCQHGSDELAFVLGHEMGHVVGLHALDRMLASSLWDSIFRLAPIGGLVGSQLTGIVRGLLEQRYSQDQELEADEFGLRVASHAGFQPSGAISLLERLSRLADEPPGLWQFFSTHPPVRLRLERLKRRLP